MWYQWGLRKLCLYGNNNNNILHVFFLSYHLSKFTLKLNRLRRSGTAAQRRVPGDCKTCKTKHMTRGMIPTWDWHVLKYIIVIARIKVTLTPVINWTGQLQHTWSVKCEEVWKKIPGMFQDTHAHMRTHTHSNKHTHTRACTRAHTHAGRRIKASMSRSHLWLAHLIITLKEKSALSS